MIYDYTSVALLDPLELDATFASHSWTGNPDQLDALIECSIQNLHHLPANFPTALATLRDFEFLIAARRVFGETMMFLERPALIAALAKLSATTKTVPRGTVYTYAAINPVGARERTFTGSAAEKTFIASVRRSIERLDLAIEAMTDYPLLAEDGMLKVIRVADDAIECLTKSIVTVSREVTPQFFTGSLRKFFDPIAIGEQTYVGPGGAQLQLIVLDYVLWGVDVADQRYQKFVTDNAAYLLPDHRTRMNSIIAQLKGRSFVTICTERGMARKELRQLLQKIRSFRYPHLKVANDNFKLRSASDLGSGAYRPDILAHIISLMQCRSDTL